MKIYIYGKFNFMREYLLPTLSAVDICEGEKVSHRWYQLSWFGKTINIERRVKDGKRKDAWFLTVGDFIRAFNKLLG
jgi:hypothetical protein